MNDLKIILLQFHLKVSPRRSTQFWLNGERGRQQRLRLRTARPAFNSLAEFICLQFEADGMPLTEHIMLIVFMLA